MIEQVLYLGNSDFQAQVLQYQCAKPALQSILIMPPTGGTNYLDRSYAKTLCENGFDVVILEHWTQDNEFTLDLQIHRKFYLRAQKAIGMVLEHIKTPFVGILGTSVGAIHAAIAVSRFEKIDAAFTITGGAGVNEIIALSEQEILVDAKKKRFEMLGFKNDQEYIHALKPYIPYEPLTMPKPNSHQILGMAIASKDTVVPIRNQNLLRKFWSPKTVIEVSGNHKYSIIKTWFFHRQKIVEFFKNASVKEH
jgi:hypothetical protein